MKSRKENFKTRFLAGVVALAMIFTMFGVMPETVKASSGVTLTEGEIYKFANCEWMAVEVNSAFTTLVMTKGNTDHGDMCGAWPGYVKNGNSASADSVIYEDISSYYEGLSYLYDQIKDKESSIGHGLYLVSNETAGTTSGGQGSGLYWSALYTAATNYSSFGAANGNAWLATVARHGYAWAVIGSNGYVYNGCNQSGSLVVAPAFRLDTSKVSQSDIVPTHVTITFNDYDGTQISQDSVAYDSKLTKPADPERTGYTFAGWSEDGTNVITLPEKATENKTYTAVYTPHTYTIRYNANGGTGTMTDTIALMNSNYNLTANSFVRDYYHFTGWSTAADGSVEYNNESNVCSLTDEVGGTVNLYAVWEPNTYTIKYDANGGTGSMADTAATYDQDVTLRNNSFTKANYAFKGWATSASGSVAYNNGASARNLSAVNGGTVTLYAVWEPDSKTITFNDYDGTQISQDSVAYDSKLTKPADPTRTGYTFTGWSENGSDVITLPSKVTENKTYTAVYTPNVYMINYHGNGGQSDMIASCDIEYDTDFTLKKNYITRDYYHFVGWATSENGNVVYNDEATVRNLSAKNYGVFDLYAIWELNTYTIKYNANGGTGSMDDTTVIGDQDVTLRSNTFAKANNTFKGWATSLNGNVRYSDNETLHSPAQYKNKTVTFYAIWELDSKTITFNDYDGTQISQDSVAYDSDLTAPADPERTGYTFTGWSENGSDVITLPAKVTENKTYTAVYTANTYTIKYDANGGSGSMTDTPATYDQDVSLRNNTFTKANNTFKGWATSASGSVAYNNEATVSNLSAMNGDEVTLYAVWEPDSKTITFNDYDGTQISQDSVAYDSDLNAPADPERTGYTFTGWSENGSDVITLPAKVTENKTYTAVYTANTYTIKYDANGGSGSMNDTPATYDQDVSLRNNTFTKANNTFKGWATSASGSVAYNNGSTVRNLSAASGSSVTLYAVWETQQSSGGNSGGSSSGSSSGSGGSSGGGGGFYVPVQPSKPEEKPEEKPAEPTEPTTDTATETIDGCTVNTTISKDAAGNTTSATAEISVPASGKISANNMSITLSSAVIAKLKELAGSADMDITIDVCVLEASTKSPAAEQKSTVVTTINTTLANLCKGSRPVRIVSSKNVLAPATLTAKADGSIVLSKLTPKYNYKVLSSKDYSSARTAIYKTAKLAKTSATIKKGKTTTIKLSTKFDKKSLKKITYSTSNKKIATVSKSGKVTGKKKGTATIKAKLYMQDGKTKTLTFKVKVK